MKRYLLFEITAFYPAGGMDDLMDSFDTWEELDSYYEKHGVENLNGEYQVFDRIEGRVFSYPSKEDMHE